MSYIDTIKYIILTIIVSIATSYFAMTVFKNMLDKKIVTVDLGKIISAQTMMANKILASGADVKPWMENVKHTSADLQKVIRDIAGSESLVIVAPAVVQGANSITNQVLIRMGLPTNVPDIVAPLEAVMPLHTLTKEKTTEIPNWMMP